MVVAKARALGLDQLVDAVSIGYVVLYLIVIALILWRAKGGPTKAIWAALVSVIFAVPIVLLAFESKQAATEVAAKNAEYLAKYEPAKAIFDKLCKEQSAPIIKRTVADVEGVLLLKVRPAVGYVSEKEKNVPDWPEAAMPGFGRVQDKLNEGYAESLLVDWYWRERSLGLPSRLWRTWVPQSSIGGQPYLDENRSSKIAFQGFRYVDIVSSDGKTRARVTVRKAPENKDRPYPGLAFLYETEPRNAPRYGVTFEDNLDPALRKHWIAGTTVKVIDTDTNDVIGEQSFWKLDKGFGATGQFGSWSTNAETCVPNMRTDDSNGMAFIYAAINPKQGN